MRHCPNCSSLIQDASIFCRFCDHDVAPATESSDKWTEFGKKYRSLSPAERRTVWDQLSPDDRNYVRKVLGIPSPDPVLATPQLSPAPAASASTGRSLKFGLFLTVSLTLSLAASFFILNLVGTPAGASNNDAAVFPSFSQQVDKVIFDFYETTRGLWADFGQSASESVATAAENVVSGLEQEPSTSDLTTISLAPVPGSSSATPHR